MPRSLITNCLAQASINRPWGEININNVDRCLQKLEERVRAEDIKFILNGEEQDSVITYLIALFLRDDVDQKYKQQQLRPILIPVLHAIFKYSRDNKIDLYVFDGDNGPNTKVVPLITIISKLNRSSDPYFFGLKCQRDSITLLHAFFVGAYGPLPGEEHFNAESFMKQYDEGEKNIHDIQKAYHEEYINKPFDLINFKCHGEWGETTCYDKIIENYSKANKKKDLMQHAAFIDEVVSRGEALKDYRCKIDGKDVNCLEKYIKIYLDNETIDYPPNSQQDIVENCNVNDTPCIDAIIDKYTKSKNTHAIYNTTKTIDLTKQKCKVKNKLTTCADKIISSYMGNDAEETQGVKLKVIEALFDNKDEFGPITRNGKDAVSLYAEYLKYYTTRNKIPPPDTILPKILDATPKKFEKYKDGLQKSDINLCKYIEDTTFEHDITSKDPDDKLREFVANKATCKCGYKNDIYTLENKKCFDTTCLTEGIKNASFKNNTLDGHKNTWEFQKLYSEINEGVLHDSFWENNPEYDYLNLLGEYTVKFDTIFKGKNKGPELYLAISNAPADIYRASSCQDWTSCINVARGFNSWSLQYYVAGHSYIAYLADKKYDKWRARMFIHILKNINFSQRDKDEGYTQYVASIQPPYGIDSTYKDIINDLVSHIVYVNFFEKANFNINEFNYKYLWEDSIVDESLSVWVDEDGISTLSGINKKLTGIELMKL